MMEDACVFCRIVAGLVPSHQVFEDEDVLAFMDHRPLNPGHILIIPKCHQPDLHRLHDHMYLAVMKTSKRLAEVLDALFEPPKVGLFVIGFHVPHAHVHVVPLYSIHDFTADAIQLAMRKRPDLSLLVETCLVM
jgi:histidine triad (HIT) family protein